MVVAVGMTKGEAWKVFGDASAITSAVMIAERRAPTAAHACAYAWTAFQANRAEIPSSPPSKDSVLGALFELWWAEHSRGGQ